MNENGAQILFDFIGEIFENFHVYTYSDINKIKINVVVSPDMNCKDLLLEKKVFLNQTITEFREDNEIVIVYDLILEK